MIEGFLIRVFLKELPFVSLFEYCFDFFWNDGYRCFVVMLLYLCKCSMCCLYFAVDSVVADPDYLCCMNKGSI